MSLLCLTAIFPNHLKQRRPLNVFRISILRAFFQKFKKAVHAPRVKWKCDKKKERCGKQTRFKQNAVYKT